MGMNTEFLENLSRVEKSAFHDGATVTSDETADLSKIGKNISMRCIKGKRRLIVVGVTSIRKMKELEHWHEQEQKENELQHRRRRRPPPLTLSSSSSLSSLSSLESTCDDDSSTSKEFLATRSSNNISSGRCKACRSQKSPIPLTTALPLLVFVDMFAVALVVPLLFQFYQSAGVTSASQRELLSSLFSLAQIVGGLVLGGFIDANWVRRKTVLYLSFGGSAVAYALIAYGKCLSTLILSRILVGLVKQTMTITKSLLTKYTTQDSRARHMGRLSASATAAWVFAPSFGATLYKYVDPRAPPILASLLFLCNLFAAAILLPADDDDENNQQEGAQAEGVNFSRGNSQKQQETTPRTCVEFRRRTSNQISSVCQTCLHSFISNLKSCFSSSALGSVVCASLVVTWVTRATNSNNLSTFFEDVYGLEPHHRGYISSYQQVLGFVVESFFIAPFLRWIGGERQATCACAFYLAIAIGLQTLQISSLAFFLLIVCPVTALAYSTMFTSLQTLVTTVAPVESIFRVLAAIDVLQNAVSATVPYYRTVLFARMALMSQTLPTSSETSESAGVLASTMYGDPDPGSWLMTCTIHWLVVAAALGFFLLKNEHSSSPKFSKRKTL